MFVEYTRVVLLAPKYTSGTDLEKAGSDGSNTCRHFVANHAILSTFRVKYPGLLTKDGGKRVEDGEWRLD